MSMLWQSMRRLMAVAFAVGSLAITGLACQRDGHNTPHQTKASEPAIGPSPSAPPPATPLPQTPAAAVEPPVPPLTPSTALQLGHWYDAVGPRRASENFGDLLVRIASAQIGKPYYDAPWHPGPEILDCNLDSFQCVSLVESSLALGRCIWQERRDATCFLQNLRRLRYRGGQMSNYASRLHYFEEWFIDNARRGHVQVVTSQLGGVPTHVAFSYMTAHPSLYPALADATVRAAVAANEADLSKEVIALLPRERLATAQSRMQNGDIVAIAGDKPGIVVMHTGFISRDTHGVTHLLHASQLHKHVMLTPGDLATYVGQSPHRRGILVARPLPP